MSEDLNKLAQEIREDTKKVYGSKRNTIIVFALLIIFVIGYMSVIYNAIKPWTDEVYIAEFAATMGQSHIDEGINKLANYAEEQAPMLVTQACDFAEQKIPETRQMAQKMIDEGMNKFFSNLEAQVSGALDKALSGRDAEISERLKELLKTKDRNGAMKQVLAEEFTNSYQHIAGDIGSTFRDKLGLFDKELKYLLGANPENLSQTDKERRELVICMLAISENFMEKEADGMFKQCMQMLDNYFKLPK